MDQDFCHFPGVEESFATQGVVCFKSLRFGWITSREKMHVDIFRVCADENSGTEEWVLKINSTK